MSASASVLPMNTQDWSPLGWTGWIALQSKGLARVFSNTTVQKHQFFGAQLSSQSNSHPSLAYQAIADGGFIAPPGRLGDRIEVDRLSRLNVIAHGVRSMMSCTRGLPRSVCLSRVRRDNTDTAAPGDSVLLYGPWVHQAEWYGIGFYNWVTAIGDLTPYLAGATEMQVRFRTADWQYAVAGVPPPPTLNPG